MSEQQDEQSDPYEGHTPGPWVRSGRFIYRDVLGDDGFPEGVLIAMAKVAVGYRGRGVRAHEPTTARANARLIADAPSLLRQTREQAAEIAALEAEIERLKQESTAAFRACVAVAAYYPGGINPDLDSAVQECRLIALGKESSGERS